MSTARARLMRRARHYLSVWQVNIGLNNQDGLTDINSDAEDFCCGLLNEMFDAQFVNLNLERMNFPAVDLGDKSRRVCVQMTSTAGAGKIDHTLDRFFFHKLNQDYDRLIVLVLGKKQNHTKTFDVKDGFSFEPSRDVWDIAKLVTQLAGLDMVHLNGVDAYLEEQFGAIGELTAPMDLPILSALDEFSFLGREEELVQIGRRFEENKQFVFLSGLGGMGKTELAVRFAQTRWGGESYFVGYTKSWKQTVLENIAPWIPELNREDQNNERIYRDAMAALRDRSAEELLILDNADQEAASLTQLKRELSGLKMRVIITTRTDYERAIDVARLHREELHQLFEQHESEATNAERDALIDAVESHTLTVDLMARALRPGRRAATAEKLLNNLSDSTIKKVDTAYPGGMKQARINEHLRTVFKVSELPEEETALLRCATLLPESGMGDALFLVPFEDREAADDLLQSLIDKGWLIWKDELLKIHPVIRLVCREELKPTDENCGAFLDRMWEQYDPDDYDKDRYRQLAELFTAAAEALSDRDGEWVLRASTILLELGEAKKARTYCEEIVRKLENNKRDSKKLAYAYNNLGAAHRDIGEYGKALEYMLKGMEIRKRISGEDAFITAASYNNVGLTYSDLGKYKKALEYQMKGLTICERVLSEGHPDLATSYNNVGITYHALGDYENALKYGMKALTIRENLLGENHPDLAASYNNIGGVYRALNEHKKALGYHMKALEIRKRVLLGDHPSIAESYNHIAYIYSCLDDLQTAARYIRRAVEIAEKRLPEGHPDLENYRAGRKMVEMLLKSREMGFPLPNPFKK